MPVQMPKKRDGIYSREQQEDARKAALEAEHEVNSKKNGLPSKLPTLQEQLDALENRKKTFAQSTGPLSERSINSINAEIDRIKSVMGPNGDFEIGGKSNKKSKKRRGKRSKKTRRTKLWSFF